MLDLQQEKELLVDAQRWAYAGKWGGSSDTPLDDPSYGRLYDELRADALAVLREENSNFPCIAARALAMFIEDVQLLIKRTRDRRCLLPGKAVRRLKDHEIMERMSGGYWQRSRTGELYKRTQLTATSDPYPGPQK